MEKGNFVENELLVGNYLLDWPKMNYRTIQFSDYKFKLDKTKYNNSLAWRATGIGRLWILKNQKGL